MVDSGIETQPVDGFDDDDADDKARVVLAHLLLETTGDDAKVCPLRFALYEGENVVCGDDERTEVDCNGAPTVVIPHKLVRTRGKTTVRSNGEERLCRPRISAKLAIGDIVTFGTVALKLVWGASGTEQPRTAQDENARPLSFHHWGRQRHAGRMPLVETDAIESIASATDARADEESASRTSLGSVYSWGVQLFGRTAVPMHNSRRVLERSADMARGLRTTIRSPEARRTKRSRMHNKTSRALQFDDDDDDAISTSNGTPSVKPAYAKGVDGAVSGSVFLNDGSEKGTPESKQDSQSHMASPRSDPVTNVVPRAMGPAAEPAVEHVVEPAGEHAVEPTVKDAPEPAVDAALEHVVEPAGEHAVEPTVEDAPEPAVDAALEHAVEPAGEHAVEDAVEPAVDHAAEPMVEPALDAALQHVVKPAGEYAVEAAMDVALEHDVEPAIEPTVEPAVEPALEPAVEHADEPANVNRVDDAPTEAAVCDGRVAGDIIDSNTAYLSPAVRQHTMPSAIEPAHVKKVDAKEINGHLENTTTNVYETIVNEANDTHHTPESRYSLYHSKVTYAMALRRTSATIRPAGFGKKRLAAGSVVDDSTPTAHKRSRKRVAVVITGWCIATKAKTKILAAFGAKEAARMRDATHIVVKDRIKRTPRFLAAISVASHVVTEKWLYASEAAGCAVDPTNYAIHDPEAQARWNFSLDVTLGSAKRALCGYAVAVIPGAREVVKLPSDEELREIVECAGGVFFPILPTCPPAPTWSRGLLVIVTPDLIDSNATPSSKLGAKLSTSKRVKHYRRGSASFVSISPREALEALPDNTLLGLVQPDDLFSAVIRKHIGAEIMPFAHLS